MNTECQGGPFLTLNADSDGWYYDLQLRADGWKYGKEIWCNLQGRYTYIIAELGHLLTEQYGTTILTEYTMTLC